MSKVVEIDNEDQFFEIFNQEDKPVMIDFYAEWCSPCISLFPVFEAMSEATEDGITVLKVNIEKNQEIAALFMVRSVPTVVTSSRGDIVKGIVGGKTPIFYKEMAETAIIFHKESK
jgi:thioredoxin 1